MKPREQEAVLGLGRQMDGQCVTVVKKRYFTSPACIENCDFLLKANSNELI